MNSVVIIKHVSCAIISLSFEIIPSVARSLVIFRILRKDRHKVIVKMICVIVDIISIVLI